MQPQSYQDQMKWILIGLVDDAIYLLDTCITSNEIYYTYKAIGHIANQVLKS